MTAAASPKTRKSPRSPELKASAKRSGPPETSTAASRELLRRLEERLDGKLEAGRAAEHDAGMLVERIASEGLYVLVKPTLREYLDARFRETGYSTLHRYRFVARRFTRASVKKHGSHLLWLGLQYLDATPEDEKPAELLRMSIVLADGSKKPFAKVTPAELKAAIVRLGGDPDGQAEPRSLPRGAGARIGKLEAELGRGLVLRTGSPFRGVHPRLPSSIDRIERGLDSGPTGPASLQRAAEAGGDGAREQDRASDCLACSDHFAARRWARGGRGCQPPALQRTGRSEMAPSVAPESASPRIA